MKKILYVEPVGHSLFTDHFQALCSRYVPFGVEVDVISLALARVDGPFLPSDQYFLPSLYSAISDAVADYDGAVIGCSSDPGLLDARRIVSIPVVGPFGAALHLAALRSDKVGVITPGPDEEVSLLWDWVKWHGLDGVVDSIEIAEVDHPPQNTDTVKWMSDDPSAVRTAILDAHDESVQPGGSAAILAERMVANRGVGALVFACTLWGGMLEGLSASLSVPVMDPCASPLWLASALINQIDNTATAKITN